MLDEVTGECARTKLYPEATTRTFQCQITKKVESGFTYLVEAQARRTPRTQDWAGKGGWPTRLHPLPQVTEEATAGFKSTVVARLKDATGKDCYAICTAGMVNVAAVAGQMEARYK